MGGDRAPEAAVRGALRVLHRGLDVALVGERVALDRALAACGAADALPVVDAPQVVSRDGAWQVAAMPRASVRVAARLVAAGAADAMLSAGPTGATLTAGVLELGRPPAVRRPAVAVVLPVGAGPGVVLVDAGGTADAGPAILVSHAALGAAFARSLGIAAPRVALLNVGVEDGKGTRTVRAAAGALDGTPGYLGSVEPSGILGGEVDVVVAGGFVGNVLLKTLEAAWDPQPAPGASPTAALRFAGQILGVRGTVLVAHGASDEQALANALEQAGRVASGVADDVLRTSAHGEWDPGG